MSTGPSSTLLRAHRRGRWSAWSAAALQADVAALAAGWHALGVRAGDRVHAVGPLGAPFVLSLLALQGLGAQLQPAPAQGALRHVLVDGTHELEALRATRRDALGTVVLAHGLPGTVDGDAVPFGALFGHGQRPVPLEIGQGGPAVLAEFDTAWAPGLALLQQQWLAQGAVLHLAEPGGDAWADRRSVRPRQWWADAATLARAAAELDDRLPWPAEQPLSAWQRWRAGRVLGLRSGPHYVSDAGLPAALRRRFEQLGWQDAPADAAAPRITWAQGLA
jgi:hypothetical protein